MTCFVCDTKGWANRGLDWPMVTIEGRNVHKMCERDMTWNLDSYATKAERDAAGLLRWKSNNSIPPKEVFDMWVALGLITAEDAAGHDDIRSEESAAAIKRYCDYRDKHGYSDEERAEMRAAFGEGATVVNVFNGKKIKL